MEPMETLSSVMNRLQKEGYNSEIIPTEISKLNPFEWIITKVYRFEGNNNPADSSILFALEKKDGSRKSLVIDAYGVYNDSVVSQFIEQVEIHKDASQR